MRLKDGILVCRDKLWLRHRSKLGSLVTRCSTLLGCAARLLMVKTNGAERFAGMQILLLDALSRCKKRKKSKGSTEQRAVR